MREGVCILLTLTSFGRSHTLQLSVMVVVVVASVTDVFAHI